MKTPPGKTKKIQNSKDALFDYLWGLWCAILGGMAASFLSSLSKSGLFVELMSVISVFGFILALIKPERAWRWCLALGLGSGFFLLARPILQNPSDFAQYVILINVPAASILFSLPAFPGAFLGVLLREGSFDETVKKWRGLGPGGTPPETATNRLSIIAVVVVVSVLAGTHAPNYIKYTHRSRTSDAIAHARQICKAVTNWVSAPNMANGDWDAYPVPPVSTVGWDGKSFQEEFPLEAGWLAALDKNSPGADPYYRFTVNVSGGDLGGGDPKPMVRGTAWSGQDGPGIYGGIIQAGGIGLESGLDLAGCKANVEIVSAKY